MNKAMLVKNIVTVLDEKLSNTLYNKGRYGELKNNKLELSLVEALYLYEKSKIKIYDYRNKEMDYKKFLRRAVKQNPRFHTTYTVYKNLRNKGYLPKTALKYGLDFRLYAKGEKPEKAHAKWLVHSVHENNNFSWKNFAGIMRTVHSVRKKLLIGIVDNEGDVTYYEVGWKKN